jgi:glycogen debranching enzyme
MTAARQPLLHDETIALRAPSQAWSAADGDMGDRPIHGFFHSDVRVLSELRLTVGGEPVEHLTASPRGADETLFVALARQLDDASPDPGVRLERLRTVTSTGMRERIVLRSRRAVELATSVRLAFRADTTGMDAVKAGDAMGSKPKVEVDGAGARWSGDDLSVLIDAPGASVTGDAIEWSVTVPAAGEVAVEWSIEAVDAIAVVRGAAGPVPWSAPAVDSGDERLARWVEQSLADLDALRLEAMREPGRQFLAAGAPWFFTLFGRDSIWAARFMLPLGTALARDTLHVLAALQGGQRDPMTAEAPGKIMHELRRQGISLPTEGVELPDLYYGTVDATPLWICLLHDAWRWGMSGAEVRSLLPHLERALAWMRDFGDSDGDGLLEYVDESGRGLANQGWKDSGDSVQWRDGTLAEGPIALCEVQAYAYEAAMHGADLLDAFGRDGSEWRAWAARLKSAFHERFWIDDPEGPYVAIALDARKRPVDTVTSNLGHLLGTGILDDRQSRLLARRLVSPELASGFGLRTMSTDSAGYWPLSYHGGSVWTHDTAIAVHGLSRAGLRQEADVLIDGLLAAASGFGYRVPELYSGDSANDLAAPVPYPAACRPQAWSAAASIAVLGSVLGLVPDAQDGALSASPSAVAGSLRVDGLVFAGQPGTIEVDARGEVTAASGLPLLVG